MACAWYTETEYRLWRVVPPGAEDGTPPHGDEDLIPIYGDREALAPGFGFEEVALYERQDSTTNVRRGANAAHIARRWCCSRDQERFVWLVGPPSSLCAELTALEVNEIAGREVIAVPCTAP